MPTREERQKAAKKNISLMKGAFAEETKAAIESAKIFEDGQGRDLEIPAAESGATTATKVTRSFQTAALSSATGKTLIVDPCAFTRPGGNYENGGGGPEQVICSESNLYLVLQALNKTYYNNNRNYTAGQLFTDRAVYIEGITFVQDGNVRKADVLAIAEPNKRRALENNRSEAEANLAIKNRIEAMLRIAAANGTETLIVNAFGTGPAGYKPKEIVKLFSAWIEAHPGAIPNIVFSAPRASFDAFKAAFGEEEKPVESKQQEQEAEEEEEELDFDPNDLPEGITFR